MSRIVSAVFSSSEAAEAAIHRLRQVGIHDEAISVVAQETTNVVPQRTVEVSQVPTGVSVTEGMGVGAGLGALFGLAASVIPGIGPFIAAGALANAIGMAGAGAVAGAVVGGVAGGLAEVLEGYGVSREEAVYFAQQVQSGGVFVAVAAGDAIEAESIERVLALAGGRTGPYVA